MDMDKEKHVQEYKQVAVDWAERHSREELIQMVGLLCELLARRMSWIELVFRLYRAKNRRQVSA